MRTLRADNRFAPSLRTRVAAAAALLSLSAIGPLACSGEDLELLSVTPATGSARGGDTVVLSGAGFSEGATVYFGNLEGTDVEVLSSGALQVTTPARLAGQVDVIVQSPAGREAVLERGFTFAPLDLRFVQADAHFLPDLVGLDVRDVAAADFNLDGAADVLLAGAGNASRILLGSGTASFVDSSIAEEEGDPTFSPSWQNDTRAVVVEDFDGDGDPDIFACNASAAANRLFANQGGASFTDVSEEALPIATDACVLAAPADLNNDGLIDIVAVASERGTSDRHLRAYLNRSDDASIRFVAAQGLDLDRDVEETPCGAVSTSSAEVTASCELTAGGADSSAHAGAIHYELTAAAGDRVVARFAVPSIGEAPVAIDFSLRGNASGHDLYVEIEDASGERFSTSPGSVDWSGWRAFHIDEIATWDHAGGNDDGIIDTPVASVGVGLTSAGGATTGDIAIDAIRLSTELAGRVIVEDFERQEHLLVWPERMSSLALADTDLDGDVDIVLSSKTSDEGVFLRLLENRTIPAPEEGEATLALRFVEQAPYTVPSLDEGISQVVAVDVDGDWDRDLVAVSGTGQDRLLVNDSVGFFFDATLSAMPVDRVDGRRARTADLDMDGHADLVIANYGEVNRLYLGRDDGSFIDKTPALPLDDNHSTNLLVFDADNDGDLDILVVNGNDEAAQLLVSVAGAANQRQAPQPGSEKSGSKPTGPAPVLSLPWGDKGASAGRIDGDESSSEGPMSFAVSADGSIYLLDQVNLRVLVFRPDGSLSREIPIAAATYQDIEITRDGRIVLLDRLAQASLLVIDQRGGILGEYPVVGDGIPEGGGITAMFARDDGVWLEFGHAYVVRVLDANLSPAARTVQPGRIIAAGKRSVGAAIDHQGGAKVWIGDVANGALLASADLQLGYPITRIVWIESDSLGYVHVFLHQVQFDGTYPQKVDFEQVVGIRFDSQLEQAGILTSQHVITEHEQFREFRVARDGSVYQMAFGKDGVTIYRWQW